MDKLQKLIDIEEIKNLKHRYFRAIDMADFDLLDNVFVVSKEKPGYSIWMGLGDGAATPPI